MDAAQLTIIIKRAWEPFLEEPGEYALEEFKRLLLPYKPGEAQRAIDRLLQQAGRKKPPTPPEIIEEMRAERRKEEQNKHHTELMQEHRNLPDDETITRQKREARAKYPWLFE